MSASELVDAERSAMIALMEEVGPDAPTLCEGWTVEDLAAHLVARERRIDSTPGLVIGALSGWTEKVRLGVKRLGFARVVERLRSGPPLWWRGPIARANVAEHYIHHEDVRRANGRTEARDLPAELDAALWAGTGLGARMAARKASGVRLELRTPDGRSRTAGSGDATVTITGPPGELSLFLAGRRDAAHVELDGPDDAVARVRGADLGI
jgi:uncharacterized protein (TIGR03085 family)